MASLNVGDLLAKGVMFGIAGWVAENALCQQDHYSPVFRGHRVPFLPIYAANGLAMGAAEPYISKWPTLARGVSYAAIGTFVEYLGCKIDRELLNVQAGYGQADALARASDGCVNFTRSALWAGIGLVAEKFS